MGAMSERVSILMLMLAADVAKILIVTVGLGFRGRRL